MMMTTLQCLIIPISDDITHQPSSVIRMNKRSKHTSTTWQLDQFTFLHVCSVLTTTLQQRNMVRIDTKPNIFCLLHWSCSFLLLLCSIPQQQQQKQHISQNSGEIIWSLQWSAMMIGHGQAETRFIQAQAYPYECAVFWPFIISDMCE